MCLSTSETKSAYFGIGRRKTSVAKVILVPGHCDPTCNLHDWYVVKKDDKVIDLWPVSARGFSY